MELSYWWSHEFGVHCTDKLRSVVILKNSGLQGVGQLDLVLRGRS